MQIFESYSSVFWQTTRLYKDYLEIFLLTWFLHSSQAAWVIGYFYSASRVNANEIWDTEKLRKFYQVWWSLPCAWLEYT